MFFGMLTVRYDVADERSRSLMLETPRKQIQVGMLSSVTISSLFASIIPFIRQDSFNGISCSERSNSMLFEIPSFLQGVGAPDSNESAAHSSASRVC